MLSYSAVVWVDALNKQHNINKLQRVQALALRMASGALPGTSNEALDQIMETPHIEDFLRGEAAKGASRLKANGEWTGEVLTSKRKTFHAHSTINNNYLKATGIPKGSQDLTKPLLKLTTNYSLQDTRSTDLSEVRKGIAQSIDNLPTDTVICYTDGSKTDSGTGYGFTISDSGDILAEGSAKLPDFCSVYQAELSAIHHAARALNNLEGREVVFYTDSLSSIQALQNKFLKSRTLIQCHSALEDLGARNSVRVRWIPGHEGHDGNERADKLAKEGTIAPNKQSGFIPQSHIKSLINTTTRKFSVQRWKEGSCKHLTRTMGPVGSDRHSRVQTSLRKLKKDRLKFRAATHVLTGHAALNYHLHKMRQVPSPTCPFCEEEDETVEHFLGLCPALAITRHKHFYTCYDNLETIFASYSLERIVSYITDTKRLLPRSQDADHNAVT